VVVRAPRETGFLIMRAGEELGFRPDEVADRLLVEEGAAVQKGTALLRRRGLFGRGKGYLSPVDGVFRQLHNGSLIIEKTPELIELRALMQGHVASVISGRGVVLEASGSLVQAVWDSGREGYGKLRSATTGPAAQLEEGQVGSDVHGCIVVAGQIGSLAVLKRAEEYGARGVIAGSMNADTAMAAMGLSFPVVLTDGIGDRPMAEPIFRLLQQSEGREATLFSRDGGRPGSRPEIVIPVPAPAEVDKGPAGQPLVSGRQVRLLRAPYASQVGRVVALHDRPWPGPLGLRLAGADVQLADKQIVFVPYANLELIG
jgi:hypothetical protein